MLHSEDVDCGGYTCIRFLGMLHVDDDKIVRYTVRLGYMERIYMLHAEDVDVAHDLDSYVTCGG